MCCCRDAPGHGGVLGSLGSDSFVGTYSEDSVMKKKRSKTGGTTSMKKPLIQTYLNGFAASPSDSYIICCGSSFGRPEPVLNFFGRDWLYLDMTGGEVRLM